MISIEASSLTDLFFQLRWSSGEIRHTDAYAGSQVNFWRDLMPPWLTRDLLGKKPGDRVELEFASGELFQGISGKDVRRLSRDQFDPERIGVPDLPPRIGRFYPKGVLKDVEGIFRTNIVPFRCVEVDNHHLTVDLGHPLAEHPLSLSVTVGAVSSKTSERGGAMQDWIETITQGVGMQSPLRGQVTDFFGPGAFDRGDETNDAIFYQKPRMVQHMDDTALSLVKDIYGRFVQPGMQVLDMMAGWDSHLPHARNSLSRVTGIGLNEFELTQNKALTDYRVHDLNADPALPLPQNTYDAVVCTGSVEYLTAPMTVFEHVAGVLRPGGHFIVTFSNRWFPPKAIALWSHLHEFERMGLVLEYFRAAKAFTDLQTYSARGLDRPLQDKYSGQMRFADPVYAVWGRKL